MPQVDPVILQLKADVAVYQRDLTRAQRVTEEKLARIDRAGFATGRALRKGFDLAKGAAVGFAGAITVQAITGAIKSGLEYAASLGEVAQQLGVTTDALQEYRYAGSQAGLTTEETDQALSQLTRRLGEAAEGTKAQAEAFQKLGIDIRDANGQVIDAGEAIPLIAEGLKRLESPAERAAVLMDLFGRSGQKLEPLLSDGASGVDNLRNAAHKLGIVLSSEQISKADETADKLDAVKQVLEAKIAGAVANNADAILALADAFDTLVTSIGNAINWYKKWKLQQGINIETSRLNGWFTSEGDKASARYMIGRYQDAINQIDRPGAAPKPPKGQVPVGIGRYAPASQTIVGNQTAHLVSAASTGPVSRLTQATSGNVGRGPGIEALLGSDPVAAVQAANIMTTEMQRLAADIAAAKADLSGDLADQAAARKQQIEADLAATLERNAADDSLSAEQRAQLKIMETERASLEKQAVDAQLAADLARETREAAEKQRDAQEANTRLAIDALSAEADLADTRTARLAIERRILELRQETERAALEEAIAAGQVADATSARADLARRQTAERGGLERDFEGPLARYARDAKDANTRVEEAAARRIDDLNDTIADTMAKKLGVKDPFLRELLKIFLDQNVFGPLAEALSRRSGGGGLLGGILNAVGLVAGAVGGKSTGSNPLKGGLKNGRASGGHVNAGALYRVNEGASPGRVEGFIPQGAGEIVPLGRMNAARGGGGMDGQVTVRLMLSDDIDARIDQRSAGVAVEIVRAATPGIVRSSVGETMRQAGRPRL